MCFVHKFISYYFSRLFAILFVLYLYLSICWLDSGKHGSQVTKIVFIFSVNNDKGNLCIMTACLDIQFNFFKFLIAFSNDFLLRLFASLFLCFSCIAFVNGQMASYSSLNKSYFKRYLLRQSVAAE